MTDFKGRKILVTGATGGIGAAIVRALVVSNAEVIAAGRNTDALATLRQEVGCQTVRFDHSVEQEVVEAIDGSGVWGVVNCGGWGGEIATPMETNIDTFDKVIAINTRGPLLVTKYAAREMIDRGAGGAIVNVSSQASLVALHNHVSYGASKAALDNITKVSALELGKYNIRVNSVHPTVVMTEMSESYWGQPEIGEPFLKAMPLGRWATEAEIAAPVVFLLSDGAAMVTGAHLPIDGGYTAQ